MFLKVPVIIILRFGENIVLGTIHIDIQYVNFGGGQGGYMVHPTFLSLLFIKTEKLQEHDMH